jgi:hypothetical protein
MVAWFFDVRCRFRAIKWSDWAAEFSSRQFFATVELTGWSQLSDDAGRIPAVVHDPVFESTKRRDGDPNRLTLGLKATAPGHGGQLPPAAALRLAVKQTRLRRF